MNNIENNPHKEEILARSRASGNDEGMEHLKNKNTKMGIYVAGTIVGAPLAFLSLISGELATFFALLTIYIAFGAGELFATYRFFNQKRYLIGAIIIALITIAISLIFIEMIGLLPGWVPRWWFPYER